MRIKFIELNLQVFFVSLFSTKFRFERHIIAFLMQELIEQT